MVDKTSKTTIRRFVQNTLGYPLEKHVYATDDGYLNTVYRIPGKQGTNPLPSAKDPNRRVVIYQHGLMDCCVGIIAAQQKSLGILLVDAGYDLWLNNSRGNRFSRDHQKIDLNMCTKEEFKAYYDFSFQEMAEYDQPALWKYVLNFTQTKHKITYIGHSQGTTQMFASLCLYPEFYAQHM